RREVEIRRAQPRDRIAGPARQLVTITITITITIAARLALARVGPTTLARARARPTREQARGRQRQREGASEMTHDRESPMIPRGLVNPRTLVELASPHPLIGTILDECYRVEAWMADGGMATVYRGTQLLLDRPVAIKALHHDLGLGSEAMLRFVREVRLA